MAEKYAIGDIRERKELGGIQKYIKISHPNKWKRFYDWKLERFLCLICEKEFDRQYRFQKFCTSKRCLKDARNRPKQLYRSNNRDRERIYARRRNAYLKINDPIKYKAQMFYAPLRWGRGATSIMQGMIKDALGTNCAYCEVILNLENISLDHKVPIIHSSKVKALQLNKKENLHFVCRKCNRTKAHIPHEKYLKLLEFLHTDVELERLVLSRLRSSFIKK